MKVNEHKEICTIEIPSGGLDNDYTFYESGRIKRLYDRHIYPGGQNRIEWLKPEEISEQEKQRLLAKCPAGCLDIITLILYPQNSQKPADI